MSETYASLHARLLVGELPRQYSAKRDGIKRLADSDVIELVEKLLAVKKSIAVEDVAAVLKSLLAPEAKRSTHPYQYALTGIQNAHNERVRRAAAGFGITL